MDPSEPSSSAFTPPSFGRHIEHERGEYDEYGYDRPVTARPPSTAGSAFGYVVPDTGDQFAYTPGGYDVPHLHSENEHEMDVTEHGLGMEDEEEEEEEEESEEEDVFAYLPPTTADVAASMPPPFPPSSEHYDDRPRTQHGPAPSLVTSAGRHCAPPPSAFIIHHAHTDSYPSTLPPITPFSHFPVETPPSTDSQADHSDPYRMRRLDSGIPLSTPPLTGISGNGSAASARLSVSRSGSRGVRVELPIPSVTGEVHPTDDNEKYNFDDEKDSVKRRYSDTGKIRPTSIDSTNASASITPSMMYTTEDTESARSVKDSVFGPDIEEEEDSPFPEVRASVSNTDDTEMPALTFRMWVIGLLLCMIGSALNVFFNFRQPAPQVVPLVLVLVSYPMGKLAAFSLPIRPYHVWLPLPWPQRFGGRGWRGVDFTFSLNPGPWNIKEHALVYIMANVAVGNPYALNAIVVAEIYYKIKLGFWFNFVTVLATQLTGFGLAGVCRRFLVWPASMVWPQNLVTCTLLNTLHAEDDAESGGLTRYKYYVMASAAAFAFFFLPGFLFVSLSVFSWVCWIRPNNVPINQLFGVYSGLGMSFWTFDWTQISWIGSPLMMPWWAECHIFAGLVFFFWILAPALYYSNAWDLAFFPLSDNQPYDRFGLPYNVTRIMGSDNLFNVTAYDAYSPLYLPTTYVITYLLAFALSTCVITHTLLYHGRALLNGLKNLKVEKDDIHAKMMRNYPEVPDWWYTIAFIFFFCMSIVAAEVWHTGVPVWALVLSVALPVLYVLPSGFIFAMTGQGITLNLLAQIIPGVALPGNPMANMVFKAYSVQTLTEATAFVQDLKLGHYIKVPPRATFLAQLTATILAAFVQVGMKEWMFRNVIDICQPDQRSSLTCPHNQVFFTASAVWGLIGPNRQFAQGSIYTPELFAIIIGVFLPLPFWLWQRRYPDGPHWLRYISTPVILNGVSFIPPAAGINYSSWFFVGFIFQYLIRKRNFQWWSKFNYVTSAALDSGTVLSLITIFFTLQFPKGGSINLNWWGNTVYENTADFKRLPLRTVPPGGL